MKITISYLPAEEREAQGIAKMICSLFERCKVRQPENHPPYRHIYVAIGSGKKAADEKSK